MRISIKFIKILTVMIILALFSVSGKMIMATTAQGSISILYKGRTKGDQEIALSKADFVLYQVGKDTTDGIWKLNEQFKQSKVSLTKEDAQSRQKQAIKLYQYAKKHRIKGTNNQTNEVGRLFFGNLKNGLYLVAQTKEVHYGKTERYISDPFLVSIPADIDGSLLYHVTAQPKSAWESNKKEPISEVKKEKILKKNDTKKRKTGILTGRVKTGDFKEPLLWIIAAVLSGCISYAMIKVQKRKYK